MSNVVKKFRKKQAQREAEEIFISSNVDETIVTDK